MKELLLYIAVVIGMVWLFIWASMVDKRNAAECIASGGQWVEYSHKMFMCADNGRKQ